MTELKLHDYQLEAVAYLQGRKKAGLFLDMGLGKTCVCLSALTPDSLPALVNGPKRVAEEVWHVEAAKWRPDLKVVRVMGTAKQRQAALEQDADVYVISRDNLADALPYAGKFRTHIIDELSGFKSHSSVRFKTAVKLHKLGNTEYVWGLTGTPSPNGYLDLWSQVALLDKGERLGKNITTYRNRYFTPGRQLRTGVITEWDIRPGAQERINTLLEDLCLSMETDGKVKLPPVTYNKVLVPLLPKVRQVYKAMKKELVADLAELGLVGEVHSAPNAAVVSSKLSQIVAGFMYVDDADLRDGAYDVLHKEKPKTLKEIIDGTGSPVLIAYRFKAELEMLKAELGPLAHTLDEPNVVERWNRGELPTLLAHPASAGHGLNLQHGGHTAVWVTLPWSLEEYQQFNKRLARQGQQHPVVIHHLISPHTVDEAMWDRLAEKKSVQQALLDHLESPL